MGMVNFFYAGFAIDRSAFPVYTHHVVTSDVIIWW